MPEAKNVFVSHVHSDDAGLPDLMDLLGRHGMDARNYSITSDKENNAKSPDYIKNEVLGPRINACSTLVVYITPNTKDSDWVNWEIEYAYKQGKTIVGVWEWGSKGCDIPEALKEFHHAIVGWNGESIVDAIMGDLKGSFNPNGTPVDRTTPLTRHPCA